MNKHEQNPLCDVIMLTIIDKLDFCNNWVFHVVEMRELHDEFHTLLKEIKFSVLCVYGIHQRKFMQDRFHK